MKISKVLSVGDEVYSAANGQAMKVTRIYSCGFDTEYGYFSFEEHRKLYWLHRRSYLDSIKRRGDESGRCEMD